MVPADAGVAGVPDGCAAPALLHRTHRSGGFRPSARSSNPRRDRPAARRCDPAGGAAIRRSARRTHQSAASVLVPVLSVLAVAVVALLTMSITFAKGVFSAIGRTATRRPSA